VGTSPRPGRRLYLGGLAFRVCFACTIYFPTRFPPSSPPTKQPARAHLRSRSHTRTTATSPHHEAKYNQIKQSRQQPAMSTPSAKGKGKSRGMSSQSRRSHSRNTTPASGSTYGDTLPSDYPSSSIGKIDYEDVFERLDLANNPGIPSSASLHTLKQELTSLREAALTRSSAAEKSMRAFIGKARDREELQMSRDKKVLEDAERKEKIKLKKRKAEPEHKRPLAVGAHQATGQGPTNDAKGQYPPPSPPLFSIVAP
jgi:hypothetical protein